MASKVEKISMPTSISTTVSKKSGFSLLEILIALALVALLFSLVGSYNYTQRQEVEDLMGKIDQSIGALIDESTIKHRMTRLRISLDDSPQKVSFEYAQRHDMTIDADLLEDASKLTESELERRKKKEDDFNKNFSRLSDLQDGSLEVSDRIKILGVGLVEQRLFISAGSPSVYFYPNGEKDPAVIFISTDNEIHYLTISPFGFKIEKNLEKINSLTLPEEEMFEEEVFDQVKEIFEEISK